MMIDKKTIFEFFISIFVSVMLNETDYIKCANILSNEFIVFLFAYYDILIAFVNCMQRHLQIVLSMITY